MNGNENVTDLLAGVGCVRDLKIGHVTSYTLHNLFGREAHGSDVVGPLFQLLFRQSHKLAQ